VAVVGVSGGVDVSGRVGVLGRFRVLDGFLYLGGDEHLVGDTGQFVEHPLVVGVDVLERLGGVHRVEAVVVEFRDDVLDGVDVERPRLGQVG